MKRNFYLFLLFLVVVPSDHTSFCQFNKDDISDGACRKQVNTVCNNPELALKMFDAGSKFMTPGMIYNNMTDYGDFPECLAIKHEDKDGKILGKYCGSSVVIMNLFLVGNDTIDTFDVDLSQKPVLVSSDTFIRIQRSVLNSSIPFTMSKFSTCIPNACTADQVGKYSIFGGDIPSEVLSFVTYTYLLCETIESNTEYYWGDILVIVCLVLILLLIIASTVYDYLCQSKPYHPLFLAFSVISNWKKLVAVSNNTTEQIQCFNGMRFISMTWVLAYHAVGTYRGGFIAMLNVSDEEAWEQRWTSRYVLSALLAVDTFFFISGFLLGFSYIKSSAGKPLTEQLTKVPKMYLHRYLRLTPPVAVMYCITITILRFMGSGPMWSLLINFMSQSCKDQWWKFFLYIQNYTNPDQMCVPPTWYLSADMQMFILAPLVLIPTAIFIKKKFKETLIGLGVLIFLSIIIPMFVRYYSYEDIGNAYTTHDRFNNFLIGFTFGAVMRLKKHHEFIFNARINVLLWVLVIVISLAFNIYWFDVDNSKSLVKYTIFMGFYKPIWCLILCFMVYSCYYNHGGIIQWFLTRPCFQILGKLSYCMYVLHGIVELYAAGTLKVPVYFSDYFLFYNWCGHIIVTMAFSVVWVLAFEYPMLTIDKFLLG